MLKALKSLLADAESPRSLPGHERRHLQVAVASLLHEASRVDLREDGAEHAAAQAALAELFGLAAADAAATLAEGREKRAR